MDGRGPFAAKKLSFLAAEVVGSAKTEFLMVRDRQFAALDSWTGAVHSPRQKLSFLATEVVGSVKTELLMVRRRQFAALDSWTGTAHSPR